MPDHPNLDARLEHARARLAANLGELKHRVNRTRRLVSPRTYLHNRWVQLGLGIAAAYVVGRRRAPKLLTSGTPSHEPEGLLHAALRSTVMALAAAVVRRVVDDR